MQKSRVTRSSTCCSTLAAAHLFYFLAECIIYIKRSRSRDHNPRDISPLRKIRPHLHQDCNRARLHIIHVITQTLSDASEFLPLLSPAHHSSSSRSKWIDLPASPRIYKQLGYEKLLRPLIKSASGQEKLSSSHTLAGVNGLKEKERDRGLNRALLDRFPIKNHKK